MNALSLLCATIKSYLLVREMISDAHKALFEVPAKRKGQKPNLFERIESELITCESSGSGSQSL